MAEFDQIIFGKKTMSDLFKDIYNNSKKTEQQVSDLIQSLKPFITNAGEAVMIVPLIKEYLEVKVKNDEHLIKMAAVVQRAMQAAGGSKGGVEGINGLELSEAEKKQLLEEVQLLGTSSEETQKLLPQQNEK